MVTTRTVSLSLSASRLMQWISAVIVMGIVSYFIANHTHTAHLLYQEVIAVLTTAFYLPALALPFVKTYRGQYWPVDLVFSYLWLTAFIFSAQDYDFGNCSVNSPPDFSGCALKRASEAFIFLAFFFTFSSLFLETYTWSSARNTATTAPTTLEKADPARPSADTAV